MRKKLLLGFLAILAFGLALQAALPPQSHMPPTKAQMFSGAVPNKP